MTFVSWFTLIANLTFVHEGAGLNRRVAMPGVFDSTAVAADSLIRVGDGFLKKMASVQDSMLAASRRGPKTWTNVGGVWVGV